jgi:putative lipoprotein
MTQLKILIFSLLLISLSLSGCESKSTQAAITGVIAHSHTMQIPVGFTLTIQIEDITKSDTPGKDIAQKVIESTGEVLPMPFEVVYDPKKIKADHAYCVQVMIADSTGKVLYSNIAVVPVITDGNPTQHIEVDVDLING